MLVFLFQGVQGTQSLWLSFVCAPSVFSNGTLYVMVTAQNRRSMFVANLQKPPTRVTYTALYYAECRIMPSTAGSVWRRWVRRGRGLSPDLIFSA